MSCAAACTSIVSDECIAREISWSCESSNRVRAATLKNFATLSERGRLLRKSDRDRQHLHRCALFGRSLTGRAVANKLATMQARAHDIGLLVIRVVVGLMFLGHGWPKLTGGIKTWTELGKATKSLGIDFAPTFFGFMASISETLGGACIALGLLFKPSAALLVATMIVAAAMHLAGGDGVMGASHAIESAGVFLGLALIGPGSYALEMRLRSGGRQ